MEDIISNSKNKILIKHNTLVAARYNLTPNECRVFTYLLYKIQMDVSLGSEKSSTITQDEFKFLISDKNKRSIKGITNILKSLKKNDIYLKEKKEGTNNFIWCEYSFISGFEFDDELNTFKIVCANKVYDILMNHDYKKDGFYTPINLLIWLQFKLNSTQRLYELLRLWSNSKQVITYSVSELKEVMMLEGKYNQYRDFKKRILIPAIEELKENGMFEIEIREKRVNRQVESIEFLVKDLDKREYFSPQNLLKIETKTESKKIEESDKFKYSKPEKQNVYIPNKKLFTAKTLNDFANDFKDIDFKDNKYKTLLQEAIMVTLDKDDSEKIYVKSYNYFKKTLDNKLNDLFTKENKNEFKKTKFHNFDETFTRYSDDEFDELVLQSQKKKFG